MGQYKNKRIKPGVFRRTGRVIYVSHILFPLMNTCLHTPIIHTHTHSLPLSAPESGWWVHYYYHPPRPAASSLSLTTLLFYFCATILISLSSIIIKNEQQHTHTEREWEQEAKESHIYIYCYLLRQNTLSFEIIKFN